MSLEKTVRPAYEKTRSYGIFLLHKERKSPALKVWRQAVPTLEGRETTMTECLKVDALGSRDSRPFIYIQRERERASRNEIAE